MLAARVRFRTTAVLPRTHMLLLVEAEGRRWLADVGFGGEGLLLPVPFGNGEEARHHAWTYRVIEETDAGSWVLQSRRNNAWLDLYAFTLEPQHAVDYEIANHYMSTHPNSRFVQTLTVQLPGTQRRMILRNRDLTEDRGDAVLERRIESDEEFVSALQEYFGLDMPEEDCIAIAGRRPVTRQ